MGNMYCIDDVTVKRVSPKINFIHPPERFVLEVRTSGAFDMVNLVRNGLPITDSADFFHFGDIYSPSTSTSNDLGHYVFDYSLSLGPETDFFLLEQGSYDGMIRS